MLFLVAISDAGWNDVYVYMTGRYMEINVVAGGATEKGGREKT